MEPGNSLQKTLDLMRQEEKGKKRKPAFHVPQEKRLQYYSGWDKKKRGVNTMAEEVGKVKKNENTDIVVQVDDFGGKKGITIREYITSEKYTGFTKQGTRVPVERWGEFKELVNKVKVD